MADRVHRLLGRVNMSENWIDVCALSDLAPDTGVCALINNHQVAIFRIKNSEQLYAINNYDPIGKANVLSRGLLCDLKGQRSVASPLYKHHYNLETGECAEDSSVKIPTYPIRINNGRVEVSA